MRYFLILLFFVFSYANLQQNSEQYIKIVNAEKLGYIDNITVNGREFNSLDQEEIVFYPEDLENGRVVIRGILESNFKNISLNDLHVEVSIDGGKKWHIANGDGEWEWSFKPIIGKTYKLSLRVVRFSKQIIPDMDTKKLIYITSIEPSRILKNSTSNVTIRGENFTKDMLLSLESKKAKVVSVKTINKNKIEAKIKVPKDTDIDVSAILFKDSNKSSWIKSKAHLWFVKLPKIPHNFKLQCKEDKNKKNHISQIYLEPKSIRKITTQIEDTGTSQGIHTHESVGAIPFLDDQTMLKWSDAYSAHPNYYLLTFYTVDKKRIKSIIIKSDQDYGSVTLSPSQLYEIYQKIPEKFIPENDPKKDEDKYILSQYTKNYPGARFLFWKVEAFENIFGCKGLRSEKIAESNYEALRMGKAPTGTVCDGRNKLLSLTKVGGSESEVFYPGDTLELYGKFSLENSPWNPKDVVIDWGDGTFDVMDLHDYDRDSALSCQNYQNSDFSCHMVNNGQNQMINIKKEHIYSEAGRFKIRVYVLPIDELQNASDIAKRNKQVDTKSAYINKEKFFYYALANNIKSDISKPYIISYTNTKKMQSSSDRIFEVYCNPLNVYIVKDPDANGPLKLTSLKITGFSAGQTREHKFAMKSVLKELAQEVSYTSVTPCNKILFAKAKLFYHGHGFVRISWYVDGVLMQEKEYELGPTRNRDNLNYADPKSWQKPIDETLSLISPKLPVRDIRHHDIKIKVEIVDYKTKNVEDQSVMNMYSFAKNLSMKRDRLVAKGAYDVKKSKSEKPCFFLYPVENGKYLQIFDIENLKSDNKTYSGKAKVLFHLTNSYGGVGEYYMPFSFSNWSVNKDRVVTKGNLVASSDIDIVTDAGVKLVAKELKAYLGQKAQIKLDISLSNSSLFLANSKKTAYWNGIYTPLSYEGDVYIKNLTLPLTRIGWSLFNISSKSLSIDLSHKEGKGGCSATQSRKWVGVNLGDAKLYPYTFHLAGELSVPVRDWIIDGGGICGQLENKNGFSHVLGEGKIGWKSLIVNTKNNALKAQYKGFYVDIPWPKVRLRGKDVFLNYTLSSKNETEVDIKLGSNEKPIEKYGSMELYVKKINGFAEVNKEWGMFADVNLVFYDKDRKQKIQAKINNMFFTIFATARFGTNGNSSLQMPLKDQTIDLGGSTLNVNKLYLKTYIKHGSLKKIDADFSAFLTLEKWSQTSTHLTYDLKKDGVLKSTELKIAKFKPVTRSYPLSKPINKSTLKNLHYTAKPKGGVHYAYFVNPYAPKSDISLYPHLAGLSVNTTSDDCSAMENDTFSAQVDTSFFPGTPAVMATFRYGVLEGKSYWLIYCKLDNAHIPLFPSVFLYMIKGGACYGFDPDELVHGSGCNSQPDTSYGLGLAFGAGVMIGDDNLVKVESTLVINKAEKKVGFYGIKGSLFKKVEIKQGKMEYVYKSHFQTALGAIIALPSNSNSILIANATGGEYGKIDLYFGSTYYFHAGTENDPIYAKLLKFKGDGYLMAGTDIKGLKVGYHAYLGFSSLGEEMCVKSKADCASLGVDMVSKFGLFYDPFSFYVHNGANFDAKACINFGKIFGKRCVSLGATGYYDLGCCSPLKIAAGVEIDFPSPVPNVGIDLGIKPTYLKVHIR